jgi:hypothetical protein
MSRQMKSSFIGIVAIVTLAVIGAATVTGWGSRAVVSADTAGITTRFPNNNSSRGGSKNKRPHTLDAPGGGPVKVANTNTGTKPNANRHSRPPH